MVTEKYMRSLNDIQTRLDKLNSQVVTGQKFTKVSEDAPAAVKSFQILKDLSRVTGYQSSITHCKGILSNAESAISGTGGIEEILHDVKTQIVYGLNGTQSQEERQIVAEQLQNMQQQILQSLNSSSAGLYYYGGANVSMEPFTVDSDGNLAYRYRDAATDTIQIVKVDDLRATPPAGPAPPAAPLPTNPLDPNDPASVAEWDAYNKYTQYNKDVEMNQLYTELMDAGLFMDLGMGIRTDSSGMIDRNSVFTYTLPGIMITGVGVITDANGDVRASGNLYDLIGEIAAEFSSDTYTHERANELYGYLDGWDSPTDPNDPRYDPSGLQTHHEGVARFVQYALTTLGTKTQYLKFLDTRMSARELDDTTRLTDTMFVDPARTIIDFDSQETAYQAALLMGTKVLPLSIFDYMR
jgi:flagellar hook-associated protein 3 FlgL